MDAAKTVASESRIRIRAISDLNKIISILKD
jgi:hypothetical protein